MRIFVYDQREFPDPDASMSIDDVRRSMTDFFPELSNATHTEKTEGDKTVITFTRNVGRKGIDGYCFRCKAKREIEDAVAVTLKNGRPATKGVCAHCGTKIFRIGQ